MGEAALCLIGWGRLFRGKFAVSHVKSSVFHGGDVHCVKGVAVFFKVNFYTFLRKFLR